MTSRVLVILAPIAETFAALAVGAWVFGQVALGAYAARILFRDLPREVAAQTMTTVFRSFDTLIAIAVGVLATATVVRLLAAPPAAAGRPWSDAAATLAAVGLVAIGLAELLYVHPEIERLFHDQLTLAPRFGALHRTSSRLAQASVFLTLLMYGGMAWRRARS